MFEKEAEEYATTGYEKKLLTKEQIQALKCGRYDGFKDGAEFGYNKAKEESNGNFKKWRKFTSFLQLRNEFKKRFEVKTPSYELPLIWVKRKDRYETHLITGYVFSEQDGQLVKIGNVYYSLGELFEHYEFLDDSPCGVYE